MCIRRWPAIEAELDFEQQAVSRKALAAGDTGNTLG